MHVTRLDGSVQTRDALGRSDVHVPLLASADNATTVHVFRLAGTPYGMMRIEGNEPVTPLNRLNRRSSDHAYRTEPQPQDWPAIAPTWAARVPRLRRQQRC